MSRRAKREGGSPRPAEGEGSGAAGGSGRRGRGGGPSSARGQSRSGPASTASETAAARNTSTSISSRMPLRPTLLIGALLLSTVLVWAAFNPVAYNGGDNAGYLALAHGLLTEGAYLDFFDPARLPHTKYPPVFPAALALLMLLGARTWVAFKLLVSGFTVAAVGFTYLWSERRLGPWGGFAVAALFAASAVVVGNSHWILSDPLFVALTMASLWALERADEADGHGERADGRHGREGTAAPGGDAVRTREVWLAVGVAAALLAYFTRSAGLPLLVAVLAWLALRRRWGAFAASAVAIGLPALAWWLRGRGQGVGDYAAEFWMVDPYQPALGTIGPGGLVSRAGANAVAYLTEHVPLAVVGQAGAWALLGIGLTLVAACGWFLRMRRRPGPSELFVPLYVGLILLWPTVWGGDRFALPLLPLAFAYGALSLRAIGRPLGRAGRALLGAAALTIVLIPALGAWLTSVRVADECSALAEQSGPFACHPRGVQEFVSAAEWMGAALPADAVVMSRKPRFLYLLSGLPSRTFPFADTPEAQLAEADAVGARYVLLDRWDALAMRYVGSAVLRQPGAFCIIRGFGAPAGGGAQLLGILPPASRGSGPAAPRDRVTLARCPADYLASAPTGSGQDASGEESYSTSSAARIPLLAGPRP